MDKEIWKDIPWYELLYQISNLWNIKSFHKKWSLLYWWKILKKWKTHKWYSEICLCKNLKRKTIRFHKLVMITFIWPQNWLDINHKNWIKTDNRLENLEYCTRSYNIKHSYRELWRIHNMQWKTLEKSPHAKKVNQYTLEWEFIKIWSCIKEANNKLWISPWSIWRVCNWEYKHSWGFKWKYNLT